MVDNFKEKVLQGFAWEAGTKVFVQVLSWISTIMVARILTPEDYGLVLISGLFTGLLGMLSGFGISSGVVQRDDVSHEDASTIFWLSIILGLTAYSVLFTIAPVIAALYGEPALAGIIRVAGLVIVCSSTNIVPHALMMRELKFKFAALTDMFSKFILITTTLWMAYSGFGYWSLVVSTVVAEFFVLIVYLFAIERRPDFYLNLSKVRDVMVFGATVLLSRILMWWNSSSVAAIVSIAFDKVVAGHLQMASTVATIPLKKIGEVFDKIAFPSIASIKGDRKRAAETFLTIHKYLLFITVPMFVGIAAISEELVTLFLGEKWHPIIAPLQIICFANIFLVSSQLIPRILEGVGDARASAKFQLYTSVLSPIGMLIGIAFGLSGVLIGWFFTLPVLYFSLLKLVRRSLSVSYSHMFLTIWPPIAGGLVISVTCALLNLFMASYATLSTLLVTKILVSALLYVVFYLTFQRDQITEIMNQFRKKNVTQ